MKFEKNQGLFWGNLFMPDLAGESYTGFLGAVTYSAIAKLDGDTCSLGQNTTPECSTIG